MARRDLIPPPRASRIAIAASDQQFPVGRVWCVGRNYSAHAVEMGATPGAPFFFSKPPSSLLPNATLVPYPPHTTALHHEVELLVAIGAGGRDLSETEAADAIVAVGVAVDLTRRDAQSAAKAKGRPWALAKGFDYAAPCSALVRVSGPLPGDTTLRLWVDDELRQEGRVDQMIAGQGQLIAALSRQVRLRPGDVILTGTPAGVGALQVGQRVRAEVSGLPVLDFLVGAPDDAPQVTDGVGVEDVLRTWFGAPETPANQQFGLWFAKDPAQDERLRAQFEVTLQRAAAGELDHWAATPRGRLALVIVLDQFSRNLYRDTPAAFAQDARARRITMAGMAKGDDMALTAMEAAFLYMPLEHGESLAWQDKSIAAFEALAERTDDPMAAKFLDFAYRHRDVVVRYGRYPHRNAIFGRDNTEAEDAYLAQPDAGF